MDIVIWHNPRCGKSRETLALLEAKGVKPRVVEYLKDPPTAAQIKAALKLLGLKARELMRRHEPEYRSEGLDDPALSEEQLVAAMAKHPILIERPVVLAGKKAALGRPPERVLEILGA